MLPSTRHFLHSVKHDGGSSIKATFAGPEGDIAETFEFFPKLFFPLRGISEEDFIDALQAAHVSPRNVSFNGTSASLKFDSFAALKSAANALESIFGFRPGVVEPERQFLISMGWGYFDSFSFESGELLHFPLLGSSWDGIDSIGLELFSKFGLREHSPINGAGSLIQPPAETGPRDKASSSMARGPVWAAEKKAGLDFFERLVYSNLLKFPVFNSSSCGKGYDEIFLENIFFSSGAAFRQKKPLEKKWHQRGFGVAEIDFSRLVSAMVSLPNTNLGLESVNCQCCRPESIDSPNILPSTTVSAKFLKEGIFFNSVSRSWAEKFHSLHGSKGSREQRKSEYCYDFFPSGPFFRNEVCELLLPDAVALQNEGSALILGISSAKWGCMNSRSALSLEIERLRSCVSWSDSFIEGLSISAMASNGVFYSQAMDLSAGFLFAKSARRGALNLLGSIPSALSSPGSGFFDEAIAFSIEAVSSAISREIELSGVGAGGRCGGSKDSKVLVGKGAVLSVSRRLSELYCLEKGLLEVRGWA